MEYYTEQKLNFANSFLRLKSVMLTRDKCTQITKLIYTTVLILNQTKQKHFWMREIQINLSY